MTKGLITVVIPIYNVEKYLDRCLKSVVGQTYRQLEIILVDDGSPDRCPVMCEEWAQKDKRIRVVHKQNAGLGMARNTGIDHATGEYICFFDSDDYVVPDALEAAYSLAAQEKADVICYGFSRIDFQGRMVAQFIPKTEKTVYSGSEVQSLFLPELVAPNPKTGQATNLHMSAWACLYSLERIHAANWRFSSERDIISEDVYSHLRFYMHVTKAAVLSRALYCYCENDTSLTQTYRPDRYKKIKHFYEESIKVCQECGYSTDVYHRVSLPFLAFTISALKQEMRAPASKMQRHQTVISILKDPLFDRIILENRSDQMGLSKSLFFFAARLRLYWICIFLLKLQLYADERGKN